MKKLIATALVTAALTTAVSANQAESSFGGTAGAAAASSFGAGGISGLAAIAGFVLVGGAIVAATGTK